MVKSRLYFKSLGTNNFLQQEFAGEFKKSDYFFCNFTALMYDFSYQ